MTTCNDCKYYSEVTSREVAGKAAPLVHAKGQCRRYAPQLGTWPMVRSDDWCGDHARA